MRGSDGTTYTRNGDRITSSRGESWYQRDEDTVIGPNGDMYTKRGNTVVGPRGQTIHGAPDDNIFFRKEEEKPKDTGFEDYSREQDERDAQESAEERAREEAIEHAERAEQDRIDAIEREKRLAEILGKNNPVSIDADGFYE